MKNFQRFYSVFFIIIIAFALDGCNNKKDKFASEDPPLDTKEPTSLKIPEGGAIVPKCKILVPKEEHKVVLLVDTEELKKPNADLTECCSFPDLNPGESSKNYTTDVLLNTDIVWLGASWSTPLEHDIAITGIEGTKDAKGLKTQNPKKGKVVGIVDDNAKRGQEITYTIHFRVKWGDNDSADYTLDPKLLIH